jgi:hypothetical protein
VGLNNFGFSRIEARPSVNIANQKFLSDAAWKCNSRSPTILVRPSASDDRAYDVFIAERIGEGFEYEAINSLSASIAIGLLIECVTTPVWGKKPGTAESAGS